MAKNNSNFHTARTTKNDEFYTQLTDIEKEMKYYRDFFKGKVVYCNCDDARESNFFKYFSMNFEFLGLKKLISTGYKAEGHGVVLVYEGDKNGNHRVDDCEVVVSELQGDGDFRSEECIEFLKEADVVVTNPPFSLFREYVAQLMEYGKKFIIIGNGGAVVYKEIFPLVRENKIWLGAGKGMGGKAMEFQVSADKFDSSKGSVNYIENGKCYVGVMMCTWFTNIDHLKRHEPLDLYKKYSAEEYPMFDESDVINVNKVADIPMDYNGVMGVPITFLDKYCPDQFEILGDANSARKLGDASCLTIINGKKIYDRLFIRRK